MHAISGLSVPAKTSLDLNLDWKPGFQSSRDLQEPLSSSGQHHARDTWMRESVERFNTPRATEGARGLFRTAPGDMRLDAQGGER